jgi:hypothetical protein
VCKRLQKEGVYALLVELEPHVHLVDSPLDFALKDEANEQLLDFVLFHVQLL